MNKIIYILCIYIYIYICITHVSMRMYACIYLNICIECVANNAGYIITFRQIDLRTAYYILLHACKIE